LFTDIELITIFELSNVPKINKIKVGNIVPNIKNCIASVKLTDLIPPKAECIVTIEAPITVP
jgi:hypothetical protein